MDIMELGTIGELVGRRKEWERVHEEHPGSPNGAGVHQRASRIIMTAAVVFFLTGAMNQLGVCGI